MQKRILAAFAGIAAAALVALGSGATGATAATAPARSISAANVLEGHVLDELNTIRRTHGLVPLRLAPSLSAAADLHSRAMGRYGFFAHDSRDGSEFWKRIQQFYGFNGYASWSVGENLLWAAPSIDASGALKLWMASPGHRENILTPRWREVGLSAVNVANAPGVYGDRDVTIITTEFGTRS